VLEEVARQLEVKLARAAGDTPVARKRVRRARSA
jgi:hypothetical protein